jgi:apolipoprotein N-acyltransferase
MLKAAPVDATAAAPAPPVAEPGTSSPPSRPSRRLWLLAFLALTFSGASQALASPPLNWFWIHPFYFVPAMWVLSRLPAGRGLRAGWWVGISANCAIFYWIVHTVRNFSNLPAPLAVLCLLLFAMVWGFYSAIWGWGFGWVRRAAGSFWPTAIAAWFTACEYLNPQLFPYYQGVCWYQQPWIFLSTALLGVPAITFFVMLCNALLLHLLEERRLAGRPLASALRSPVFARNGAVLAAFLLVALPYAAVRDQQVASAEASPDTLRVALVQTNRGIDSLRQLRRRGKDAVVNDFVDLSWEAENAWADKGGIDVFVWPEGALPGTPMLERNRRARDFARETGAEIWTGGSSWTRDEQGQRVSFNSAFRLDARGELDRKYDKNILLPFGEFMPLEDKIPILKKIQGPGDYDPGDGLLVFQHERVPFTFLICYEAIRHRYVGGGVREGARLLVNITYDAWFGDTSCPSQHLMLSVLQGAQYGVPVIRAATTGISAVADARGVILEQTPVFTRGVLVRDVPLAHVPAPIAKTGDWFAWLCVLGSTALLLAAARRDPPRTRRAWTTWAGLVFASLWVPVAELPDRYVLLPDKLLWAVPLGALLVIGVAWRRAARP